MGETIVAGGLEFHAESRMGGGGGDGGPSLQVYGDVDGSRVQVLRFDMFRKVPHYHYAPMGQNLRYDLDPLIVEDGIGWVMSLLANKLPQMLTKAGHEGIATQPNVNAAVGALPELERKWRAAV